MKRRVLLAGLGTASIGVGAAFGSGAFTTIEADRTVELNVSNDSSAQIALKKGTGKGADRLIKDDTDGEGDIEVIKFAQGSLNRQSKTIFNEALTIKNNTDNLNVELYVSETAEDSNENDLDISGGPIDFQVSNDDSSIVEDSNTNGPGTPNTSIDAKDSVNLDIVINLREDDISDDDTGAEDKLKKITQVTFVVNTINDTTES